MKIFFHALNIVAPVFLIVFIGYGLRRKGWINETYTEITSKLIFSVAMPMLVFVKISTMPIHEVIHWRQIGFACSFILVSFFISWIAAIFLSDNGRDRGAFIQGAFRSNFAIFGFALLSNAYGREALGKAAVLLTFVMILYNVLAVVALTIPMNRERKISLWHMLQQIIKNPLVLATLVSVPISILSLPLPFFIEKTAEDLASLTLPLALLGIGGSLSFSGLRKDIKLATAAAVLKIVIFPFLATFCALYLGFRGVDLGVLFFLFASPTAIASYVMADAMGSNSRLAGHIILVTTLGSLVTIAIGITWLTANGLM